MLLAANLKFGNEQCPICLETARVAYLPKCQHPVCLSCLTRVAWNPGPKPDEKQRVCDHPEVDDTDGDDGEHADEEEEEAPAPEYLGLCPLCRAPIHHDWSNKRAPSH